MKLFFNLLIYKELQKVEMMYLREIRRKNSRKTV